MLVGILEAMYEGDSVAIDVNGRVGGLIGLTRGVKQGKFFLILFEFNILLDDRLHIVTVTFQHLHSGNG